MKKVAVIGGGTVGALTAAHWNRWSRGAHVDWIISPDIPAVTVGEGTTVLVAKAMEQTLGLTYNDLANIGGTPKLGLWKRGWGGGDEYKPPFALGEVGVHMTATMFHDLAREKLADKVNIVYKTVDSHLDVDADLVADCSGTPKQFDGVALSQCIPVNAVHVTQCPWDAPKFFMSMTMARKFGWVFGIPLKNRCAIGYLYNKDIDTIADVKADVENVFDEFGLTPSTNTLSREFKNYYREHNYTDRVYYNGNASFFLEPLEATSLGCAVQVNQHAWSTRYEGMPTALANQWYRDKLGAVEDLIMLHYYAGSCFKTPFWDFAKERGVKQIETSIKSRPLFREILAHAVTFTHGGAPTTEYGTWGAWMWHENLKALGVMDVVSAALSEGAKV